MLVFVGDVDEEGHNGGVPLHQLNHEVETQMHTLTDQARMPGSTAADQAIQGFHHHFTLGLVALHQAAKRYMPWRHAPLISVQPWAKKRKKRKQTV